MAEHKDSDTRVFDFLRWKEKLQITVAMFHNWSVNFTAHGENKSVLRFGLFFPESFALTLESNRITKLQARDESKHRASVTLDSYVQFFVNIKASIVFFL